MTITKKKSIAVLLVVLMMFGLITPTISHAADVRGDITFVKVKENSFDRLANVAFKLTNDTTGEYHILVTDVNGEFSTANSWHAHSDNTNGNDAAYDEATNKITGALSGPTGIWFSEESTGTVATGTSGALPVGTYTLDEIECTANQGLELVTGIKIEVSKAKTVDLGVITSRTITLDGDAVDYDTDLKKAFARENLTIEDTVDYDGVITNTTYHLEGKLVDKATGNPILVDGEEVTASKEFNATGVSGNVVFDFTFDASGMEGKDIVVFTYLYKDQLLLSAHEETTDVSQTIEILDPQLTSEAINDETGNHLAASTDVSITDTIKYTDLLSGNRYSLTTTLVDEDGEELVSNTKEIHPNLPNGTVTETLTFDATGYEGKTVIMTQKLVWDGVTIATHDDLTDVKQQIRFPKITTSVIDDKTKDRVALAEDGVKLIDTVTYSNVYEGTEIKLVGTLMDENGEVFKRDGAAVTSEVTLTPDTREGTQDVVFEFDGPDLENKTLVVFEELYTGDNFLTDHKDLSDEKQTMRFPEITTLATDSATEDHIAFADNSVRITDKVSYKNLLPGKEYSLSGALMNAETGDPLQEDGEDIVATATFTPDAEDGTTNVTFEFNASTFEGLTSVVFETLYLDDDPIAIHEELGDKNQQVNFPKVRTSAVGTDTKDHIALADKVSKITDTVVFENLLPDKEYKLAGTLMDPDTGESIKVDGKAVTATATFTPKTSDGTAEVDFIFDGTGLKGKTVVIFEELTFKNEIVGQHKDADDVQQQVKLPKVLTSAVDGKTNDRIIAAEKNATIIDTIEYSNVIDGKTYNVIGRLIDKETEKPLLIDGKEVTATGEFTAAGTEGTTQVTFNFDASSLAGKTVVVFETLYLGDKPVGLHNDINDANQTVKFPGIDTTATDSVTGDHVSAAGNVTINDKVDYKNVIAGREYTLNGVIYDAATGNPFMVNGQQVTAQKTFTANSDNGTQTLSFTFEGPEDKKLVVYQTLLFGDREIAKHHNINDADQTVYIPAVNTSAKASGGKMELAGKKAAITDTVSYSSLLPSKTYKLEGVLMDAETGDPVKVDGKNVTAETEFKATSEKGKATVKFNFDASSLKGKTVVVYEALTLNGKAAGEHKDIADEAQTIYFPEIQNDLIEGDGDVYVSPLGEVTLTDTVTYDNVVPGLEYKVKSRLIDENTGEPLKVDGKNVTASATFTAEETSGEVEVVFAFDATGLEGKVLFASEELTFEDAVVAENTNPDNKVFVRGISTKVVDSETGKQMSYADEEATLTDIVTYENLEAGMEHTLVGTLVNKEDGKELTDAEGNVVTSETVFTPEKSSGEAEVVFTVNASELKGKTYVVFEELYTEEIVEEHKDINDKAQTVYFPEIKTTAFVDTEDNKTITKNNAKVTDRVEYKNLIPGEKYTLTAALMDKETEKSIATGQAEFTAEKASGHADVEIKFDAENHNGKELVVYETLWYTDKKVADHEDINDPAQTVKVDIPAPPQTGDNTTMIFIIFLMTAALAAVVGIARKKVKA